jgi:hypothetical protein
MADQPTTPSGSRWEPDHDESAPTTERPAEATSAVEPNPGVPVATPDADSSYDAAAEVRRAQLRSRAILAGAATAIALGGGLTGFVIGHSTAGDGTNGFRPANFSGQQPGQLGDGQQGPPGFSDQDGDGFGGPPDGNGGSSDGSTSDSDDT